jgi:predicted ribosomally synthesized peptide with SipW-like signal peptide
VSPVRRLLASALLVGVTGLLSGAGTVAAFSSTAQDGGNAFEAA